MDQGLTLEIKRKDQENVLERSTSLVNRQNTQSKGNEEKYKSRMTQVLRSENMVNSGETGLNTYQQVLNKHLSVDQIQFYTMIKYLEKTPDNVSHSD